ncbi:MAG: hypothetical protein HZC22_13375 [Rhodocyclales bacterium]|nr:hypothetical protein [Rhodocyclales bacterium]
MIIEEFENKFVGELLVLAFNYGDELDTGETLQTVTAVEVLVKQGVDATPNNLLNGNASIDGVRVLQPIKAGVAGVQYELRAWVQTSNVHKLIICAGRIYVE